jgi:hypothetical protein
METILAVEEDGQAIDKTIKTIKKMVQLGRN